MNPKLTLGTAQFGMKYGINNKHDKPSLSLVSEMLDFAVQNGINTLDTAIGYGNSEEVLGHWSNIDNMYVTTKIPSLGEVDNLSQVIEGYVVQSLKRLKIDKLATVMLHDIKDLERYKDDIVIALKQLKVKGLTDEIGCSIYDLNDLKLYSEFDLDVIQLPGSLFNQSLLNSDILLKLKEKGVKVLVRSAFVQGLIFMDLKDLPSELLGLREYLSQLQTYSKDERKSIAGIALQYLKQHPLVDYIIVGVDTKVQLEEIIYSYKDNVSIDPELLNYFSTIPIELVDPRQWRL